MYLFFAILAFFTYSGLITEVKSISNMIPIQSRILYSSALHFWPALKIHHIVLFSNHNGDKVVAMDFTPINQTSFTTLSKLFLGYDVPAEIRVVYLKDSYFLDTDSLLIDKWAKNIQNMKSIEYVKIDEWKSEMNLYRHNCQHFSKWANTLVDTNV